MVDDERTWVTVEDVVVEPDDFEDIGQDHGERGRSGPRQSRRSAMHGVFVARSRQVRRQVDVYT